MNKSKIKTYVVLDTVNNLIKIGKSQDVLSRLHSLQCGSSSKLELLHTFDADIERLLHVEFQSKRVRGEWFDVPLEHIVNYSNKLDISKFQVSKDKNLIAKGVSARVILNGIDKHFEENKTHLDEDGFECKWLEKEGRYSDYGLPYFERLSHKDERVRKEYDMINLIVFGKISSMLRILFNVSDYDDLGPSLPNPHFNAMRDLQRANTVYIEDGLDFQERKAKLQSLFDRKHKSQLIAEIHLINA